MPFSIRRFQERQKKRKVSAKIFFSFRGALSVSYTTDLKQQVDDMLGALDIVIVVLTISAGMLAFVVLYNLNNINITERKRELATLKSFRILSE